MDWKEQTGEQQQNQKKEGPALKTNTSEAPITCAKFVGDGAIALGGDAPGVFGIYDYADGKTIAKLQYKVEGRFENDKLNGILAWPGRVNCLELIHEGGVLVSGHEDGFRVWDLSNGEEVMSVLRTRVSCLAFDGYAIIT